MSFEKLKLTNKGRALLAKTGAGGTLTFTKIKMGDGQITSQVIENMTALINEVVALRCNAPQRSGDFVTVTANFKNAAAQDAFTGDGTKTSFKLSAAPTALTSVKVAGTETTGYIYTNGTLTFSAAPASGDIILVTYNLSGFYFREIGFFANDPDEGEIMFAYQNAGSLAEYIAAASSEVIEKTIGATFTFSDSVTVTVDVTADGSLILPIFLIVETDVSVSTSAWASDTTHADYPFKATIPITGCTVNHIPDVMLSLEDAMSGNIAPVADSYAGGIYIYAKEKPTSAMTIPTIKLTKVVS